jgi:hypothetical protein
MVSLLLLPEDVYKRDDGRWCRECPKCGIEIDHLRRNYCIHAHNIEQPCKRCSNKDNSPSGMVGSVRLSWYNSFCKSALTRGYSWDLTPEYIDVMHQEQAGLCVYSGLPIGWDVSGWKHTASIDRIDNELGYFEDNVQLVHKEVNMMRGSLHDDRFKELCSLISTKLSGK